MKKKAIVRNAICLGSVMFLLATPSVPNLAGSIIDTETGLAGVSLSLDKYFNVAFNNQTERSLAGFSKIADNLTVDTKGNITAYSNKEQEEDLTVPLADTTSQPEEANSAVPEENAENSDSNSTQAPAPETSDTPESQETNGPEETEEPEESELSDVGVSIADGYVHVRKKPDTESEIVGKLYRGCAATILARKGEWVKIKSGNVEGYINSEYLAIGFDAEELVDQFGTKLATVNTTTLKVREKPSIDSITLTLVPKGEVFEIVEEKGDWVKILIDAANEGEDSTEGYVSKEFVDISVEFEHAISIEEEQEQLRREEEARQAEEEAARRLEEKRKAEEAAKQQQQQQQQQQNSQSSSNQSSSSNSSSSNQSSSNSSSSNSSSSNQSSSNSSSSNSSSSQNSSNSNNNSSNSNTKTETPTQPLPSGSGSGADVANFAVKFVGRPYVLGGTSLTNGADCSGFTQTVYSKFGISIPRTSSAQSGYGQKVSLNALQPGDLVFYTKNGRVNHVALYIGGGQVVHASNPTNGIMISNMYYRTPYCARRVMR